MKRKVKKFGRGGDILTGIGAGLAGYGIYKALTKGKDQDDDYTRRVKEYGTKGRFPEESTHETAAPKKEEPVAEDKVEAKTDSGRNSGRSPVEEHAYITRRDSSGESSDTTPAPKKAVPKKAAPKKAAPKKIVEDRPKSFTGEGMAGADKGGSSTPKSVVFKKDNEVKKEPTTINKALKAPAPDLSVPKAINLKGTNKTVYGTDTTSVFQRRAAEARKEKEDKERKAAETAKKRKDISEIRYDEMGNPYKRGGAVKKYASGGTVKRSASSRADGIAIRGKTRA